MQPKDAILKVTEITFRLDKVSFKDVLELTSPYELHRTDRNQQNDKNLIETIAKSCKGLVLCNKTNRRFQGPENTEYAKLLKSWWKKQERQD